MRAALLLALLSFQSAPVPPQQERPGSAAYRAFRQWREASGLKQADWGKSLDLYRIQLLRDGYNEAALRAALDAIEAYGESELYDGVYAAPPAFNTRPNRLLTHAVRGRVPGSALDVGMGQGRNSVFLAAAGWKVTGFDVSPVGLSEARRLAASRSVPVRAVLSSDADFDFGEGEWDLIALIYPIEKRSVHRVRKALKPGGLVVVEAGHRSASGAPFEYRSDELLEIFKGFRIIHYEECTDIPDWGEGRIRLVRLIAEKPF